MPSFSKFSSAVLSVVALGVGVVAVGWIGWKAYVKVNVPVVQARKIKVEQQETSEESVVDVDFTKTSETADGKVDPEPDYAFDFMQNSTIDHNVQLPVERDLTNICQASGGEVVPDACCASSLNFLQESLVEDTVFDYSLLVEADAPLAPDQTHSIEAAGVAEPTPVLAQEVLPQAAIQHEVVQYAFIRQDEQPMQEAPGAVADAPVVVRNVRYSNKAQRNKCYQRRLLKRATEREKKRALLEQQQVA